ncbi:hypothetical protein, conserved [Leishmania donovani]|uniref:Uncharacterized protein n=1 Tax=Leishmania donovani TaxID=5661 RepID=E9BN13_LEIDO|nr:hypothetical protein, conserved [Leishmania donovani]CBZ36641.1 hypothetical protein, conserved [Leishmania donovani]
MCQRLPLPLSFADRQRARGRGSDLCRASSITHPLPPPTEKYVVFFRRSSAACNTVFSSFALFPPPLTFSSALYRTRNKKRGQLSIVLAAEENGHAHVCYWVSGLGGRAGPYIAPPWAQHLGRGAADRRGAAGCVQQPQRHAPGDASEAVRNAQPCRGARVRA